MLELVPDVNIQGHYRILESMMRGSQWNYFWTDLRCATLTFQDLALRPNAKDNVIWNAIRQRDAILITGNRNEDGPNSLGAMIRSTDSVHAMPVMTISDTERILQD